MIAETKESIKSNETKMADHLKDALPGSSKSCKSSGSKLKIISSFGVNEGTEDDLSLHSIESFVCRICHNNEDPDRLISPCLCKGSLSYVHSYCLERWISMSACTACELCHFQYNTEQTLRYTFYQSLRIWYSRYMSRRALQEDCQMFLLLTLIAFGIVGTLLVAVQFYILQSHVSGLSRLWTRGWLIFFLITTMIVYIINSYLILKAQLLPWYRWWQGARDIRLILENHNPPFMSPTEIKTDQNAFVEETEEASSQNGIKCNQQNRETPIRNDEPQLSRSGALGEVDMACKILSKPLENFIVCK